MSQAEDDGAGGSAPITPVPARSGAMPSDGPLQVRRDGDDLLVRHAPPPGFRGRASAAVDAARLIERARRHEALRERTDAWARVGGVRVAGGVTEIRLPDRGATLAAFAAARVVPGAAELQALVGRLCDALEAHRDLYGTLPARVRARDVLLAERSQRALAGAELMLLGLPDPGRGTPEDVERELLRSIGAMIGRLVEGWDDVAPVRPPLRGGPRWRTVGRSGDRWLDLVNALLDPEAGREPSTLAALRAARPREPRSRRPLVVAAAVLVVGGAVAASVVIAGTRPLSEQEVGELQQKMLVLSSSYDAWMDELVRILDDESGRDLVSMELPRSAPESLVESIRVLQDTVLTPIARRLDADEEESSAAAATADPFSPLRYVAGLDRVEGFRFASQVQQVLEVDDSLVRDMLAALDGGEQNRVQARVRRAVSDIEGTAGALRAWRDRDDAADLIEQLRAADRAWTGHADALAAPLATAGADVPRPDAVMDRVRAMVAGYTALADMAALDELTSGTGPAAAMVRGWVAAVDRRARTAADLSEAASVTGEAFARMGAMRALAFDDETLVAWSLAEQGGVALVPPPDEPPAWYDGWRERVAPFRRLETDPRGTRTTLDADLEAALADVEVIRRFEEEERALAVESAVAEARRQLDELFDRPAIVRERQGLAEDIEAVRQRVAVVVAEATSQRTRTEQAPPDYIIAQREVTFEDAALQRLWNDRLARGQRLIDRGDFEGDDVSPYIAFRRGTADLEAMLRTLATETFPLDREEPVAFDGFDLPRYREAVATARAAVMREAVEAVEDTMSFSGAPDPASPAYATRIAELAETHEAWHRTAVAAVEDHRRIAAAFERGHDLTEPIPGGGTVDQLDRRWRPPAGEALEEAFVAVEPSVRQVTRRVDAVRQVVAASDDAALLAAVGLAPAPERIVAGWRRLAELPVADPGARLDAHATLSGMLRQWMGRAPDERQTILEAERVRTGAARWAAVARAGGSMSDLRIALEALGAFAVDPAQLEPELRWNVLAWEAAGSLAAGDVDDDAAARVRLRRFLADVEPFLAELDAPAAVALHEELSALAAGEDDRVDFAAIGPAGASDWWTFDAEASGRPMVAGGPPEFLVYRCLPLPRDLPPVTVVFRIAPEASAERPVYVATEEASIGLVRAIMRHSALLPRITEGLAKAATEALDGREGPRAWKWIQQRGDLDLTTDGWMWRNFAATASHYPGGPPPSPSQEHPFQHLTQVVALMVAAEVGCRLPTSSELRAVITETLGTGDPAAIAAAIDRGAWPANVRDRLVARQREWAIEQRRGTQLQPFRPEMGAFEASAGERRTDAFDVFDVDDGSLWFRRVSDDPAFPEPPTEGLPPFLHVVGNVAEFTVDGIGRPIEPAPGLGAGEVATLLQDAEVAVMGGSALSAPDVDPLTPMPVRRIRIGPGSLGWSDVGFRLAFAPRGRFTSVASFAATRCRETLLVP